MLPPIVIGLFLLACNVRSEVSQDSPVEQIVKDIKESNTTGMDKITKLYKDYENLTLDVASVPSVRYGEDSLREECEKNGGNGTYEVALKAYQNMRKCFTGIVSFAELPAKIKKSKPYGELDTVFKEYCSKTLDIRRCVTTYLIAMVPCMDDRHKYIRFHAHEAIESIMDFVCENEGDHIALFMSEKGPECILSKQAGIKKCFDEKLPKNGSRWKEDPINLSQFNFANLTAEDEFKIKDLGFDLTQCRIAYQLRKCIVEELTTCSGSTPANVVDSMFNLVHTKSYCNKYKMQDIDPDYNGGTSLFTSLFSVILPALTVLLVRTFSS
ncbi:27 kDa hemolymph protein-like [Planococcus citri]|uniref:27 kDa hemolymph protein-like n=1 Tax=Planococcus citri TaxID=170843 RepID=UPI0031F76692